MHRIAIASLRVDTRATRSCAADDCAQSQFVLKNPLVGDFEAMETDDSDTEEFECRCTRTVGVRFFPTGGQICMCGVMACDALLCQYCHAVPVAGDEELCETCIRLSDEQRMVCSQRTDRIGPRCDDVRNARPSAAWWSEGSDAFCDTCVMYCDW